MHAIYTRVSTEEQAKSGYSLANQIRANKQKLSSLGINTKDVIEYVDDGYSGEFLDRPALDKLRQDIRNKKITGYISILDPDRLSRNLTNTLLLSDEFERAGTKLIFVTAEYESSPEGKLFFSIRGAVAAFEKAKIRERVMHGKKEKALSGKIVTPKPKLGYDIIDGVYEINPNESKIVKEIYSMCIDKKMGLERIAKHLNDKKILNKFGRPFKIKYIHTILKDTTYSGTLYEMKTNWRKTGQREVEVTKNDKSDWIPIAVPAIVTLEDQIKVKKQFSENIEFARRNKQREYMLTGLLKCGYCGYGMLAISYNRKPRLLKYYVCYGKRQLKICPDTGYVHVDELETAVWEYIVNIAKGTGYLPSENNSPNNDQKINKLKEKYIELEKNKDNITNLVLEGLIDNVKARKKLRQLTNEINSIETQISELKISQESLNRKVKIELADVLAANTTKKRNKLLCEYGITVVVYKKKGQELKYRIIV